MTVHGGKVLLADVLAALGSLLLLAILQNTDVIVLGSLMHQHTRVPTRPSRSRPRPSCSSPSCS